MLENNSTNNIQVPIYAIDTNVLISMWYAVYGETEENNFPNFQKRYEQSCFLLDLLKKKKIQLVVPMRVLAEVDFRCKKNGNEVAKFAKSGMFLRPDMRQYNSTKYFEDIKAIANIYTHSLSFEQVKIITKNNFPNKIEPELCKGVFGFTKKGKPKNDAYIMAECATLGLQLITHDFKDFIAGNKTEIIAYKNNLINLPKFAVPLSCGRACEQIRAKLHISEKAVQEEKMFQEFYR